MVDIKPIIDENAEIAPSLLYCKSRDSYGLFRAREFLGTFNPMTRGVLLYVLSTSCEPRLRTSRFRHDGFI